MARKKLTHLQEKFKNNILKGMNQVDAYQAAGYKCSKSQARKHASRLVRTNEDIRKAIEEAQKKAADAAEITQQRILIEYAKIAFLDPTLLFDGNGNLKDVHKLDKAVAAVIGGMDILQRKTKNGNIEITKKIKLIDKKGALDSLARIKGMFDDKLSLGFSAETLSAVLAGLPEEYAKSVRESLSIIVKGKKK